MSKRSRKKRLPRRYASTYVNVYQKPRVLILDEETPTLTDEHSLRDLTRGELQDLNAGDYWFDNKGRVQSLTGGAMYGRATPIAGNTFTNYEHYQCPMCGTKATSTFVCKKCTIEGTLAHPRAEKIVQSRVPTTKRYSLVEKKYNETTGQMTAEVPRRTVEKLIRILTGSRGGTEDWHYQTIAKTATYHLKLFFYGTKYRWVEEFLDKDIAKRSYIYGSRDNAMKAMLARDIGWETLINLKEEEE